MSADPSSLRKIRSPARSPRSRAPRSPASHRTRSPASQKHKARPPSRSPARKTVTSSLISASSVPAPAVTTSSLPASSASTPLSPRTRRRLTLSPVRLNEHKEEHNAKQGETESAKAVAAQRDKRPSEQESKIRVDAIASPVRMRRRLTLSPAGHDAAKAREIEKHDHATEPLKGRASAAAVAASPRVHTRLSSLQLASPTHLHKHSAAVSSPARSSTRLGLRPLASPRISPRSSPSHSQSRQPGSPRSGRSSPRLVSPPSSQTRLSSQSLRRNLLEVFGEETEENGKSSAKKETKGKEHDRESGSEWEPERTDRKQKEKASESTQESLQEDDLVPVNHVPIVVPGAPFAAYVFAVAVSLFHSLCILILSFVCLGFGVQLPKSSRLRDPNKRKALLEGTLCLPRPGLRGT